MTRREYLRGFPFAFQRRWVLVAIRYSGWQLGKLERMADRQLAEDFRRGIV